MIHQFEDENQNQFDRTRRTRFIVFVEEKLVENIHLCSTRKKIDFRPSIKPSSMINNRLIICRKKQNGLDVSVFCFFIEQRKNESPTLSHPMSQAKKKNRRSNFRFSFHSTSFRSTEFSFCLFLTNETTGDEISFSLFLLLDFCIETKMISARLFAVLFLRKSKNENFQFFYFRNRPKTCFFVLTMIFSERRFDPRKKNSKRIFLVEQKSFFFRPKKFQKIFLCRKARKIFVSSRFSI